MKCVLHCIFFLLLWITPNTRVCASHQGIPLSVVKLWASAFGGEMKSIAAKYSGSQLLQKKYKELEQSVRVEEIDGIKLVKKLAGEMEQMFHKKAEAIKRLVEAAEEAHLNHEEDPELQYEYFNAVLINEMDEEGRSLELGGEFILQPNEHFNNLSVNLSLSVVQVPTNMYNKDSAIVNGVYWSEALNKVFVDNFRRDPTLIWQYFGSAKGFFRQYPDTTTKLGHCFNETGRGSVCSQAIMLVTDGAVDTYDAVFAQYNWPDRKVRVFPYLIGRESAFADNLKWMACANKGYFTQISTLADVQENVMEYLHVLSRPKVIDREHDMVWTEAYVDNTRPQAQKLEDAQGPVLMTTVAMPVFSTKNETRNKGILLGVVGTDVPVSEILKAIPKYKLEDAQGPVLMTTVAMPVFSTKNETRNKGILLGVVGTDVPVSEILKAIPKYK
ncbi:voltage-dependent calcium channel subunit alpha-2/delta-3-like, partial [Sinocyclocheilus grahami]|uniref:voltage-dependent calcium channel subunit alpha-2/delta-3-like n=1 Tax=Sinocyclocheilus grahami TaxID=75366 RepID=UPI0007AD6620